MSSPYDNLPPSAYWRTGVAERAPLDPGALYTPRFRITKKQRIVTAGSCFAQHVGRTLRQAGFNILDGEPLPDWVPRDLAQTFGYGLFSGRYGNIYTPRHLRQLLEEATGAAAPALPVWEKGARFVDAQRPAVEPGGLPDAEAVMRHRAAHLAALRDTFQKADIMVFTFGLTETWEHRETGTVYPTAPGTIAGSFDPEVFAFRNLTAREIFRDFVAVRDIMMAWNPKLRFLITVSPVPLTATASGAHVEVATCYSKSVLRTVCGMLTDKFRNIDYFPSYELITSQTARGAYYHANMRNVTDIGVAAAMSLFLTAHGYNPDAPRQGASTQADPAAPDNQEICEDALLEAFAK